MKKESGYTLIELIITVAIVAIVLTLVYSTATGTGLAAR